MVILQRICKQTAHISLFAVILFLSLSPTSCTPPDAPAGSGYSIDVASTTEGDIPIGMGVEVILGVKNFTATVQHLYFDFQSKDLSLAQGGGVVLSGSNVTIDLEGTALIRFTVTGLTVGKHTVKVRAENGSSSATCDVTLSFSDRVYAVNITNTPVLRVGEQMNLDLQVVDMQDPQHLFYTTPGYKVSVRSLDDKPAMIWLGVDLIWDNFTGANVENTQLIQWNNNEYVALYKGFSIGEHKVEFKVTDPKGISSRSVHTLQIDSTKLVLKPRNVPKDTVKVTDEYYVSYDVDYLGHPNNKVSVMWEPCSFNGYLIVPDLLLEGVKNPPAGEWSEFRFSDQIGVTAYPKSPVTYPNGGVQGFTMHVRDMYGWETSYDYVFNVESSQFNASITPPVSPYYANHLKSAVFSISNYPKGMTYRYKLVPPHQNSTPLFLYDKFKYDTWYDVNLAGADGTPFNQQIFYGFGYEVDAAGFDIIIEDKFGSERRLNYLQLITPNKLTVNVSPSATNLVVGDAARGTVTFNLNLSLPKSDASAFTRTELYISDCDPTAIVEVDGTRVEYDPITKMFKGFTTTTTPKVKYTPTRAGIYTVAFSPVLWTGGGKNNTVTAKVNTIANFGSFAAAVDKSDYLIPYEDPRVYQDITVTLTSAQEPAGIYDWDDANHIGTSVKYEGIGSVGRVAYLGGGVPVEITRGGVMDLKGAIGKTFTLRYYPAAINNGSYDRVKLTFTRKDGATTQVNFNIEAEDEGFEVVIGGMFGNTDKVGTVSLTSNLVDVTSKSKYYQGGYQLQSHEFNKQAGTGKALIENCPLVKGFLKLKHTALEFGWVSLKKAVVVDENRVVVTGICDPEKPYYINPAD